MKNQTKLTIITTALLLIAVFILSGQTSTNKIEVVPAKPKQVVVKSFRAAFYLEKEMTDYIIEMCNKGYIVKSVTMMDDETFSKGIVVVEKY